MQIGKKLLESRGLLKRAVLNQFQQQAIQNGHGADTCVATEDSERQFEVKGYVTIEAEYANGEKKVLLHEEQNLVVRQAQDIMPYMTMGLRTINYIELGDPSPASPPDLANIALEQTTGQRKATTYSITANSITYTAQWLTSEGNGFSYTEAGLFTDPLGTGLLFARKTFDPITKNSSFSLTFKWTIVFTVSFSGSGCQGVALLGSSVVTSDYAYTSPSGGETDLVIPIDFAVGAKQLDVFLNGQRLVYNAQYFEKTIGSSKAIEFMGFSLITGDVVYIVKRNLA